MMHELVHGGDWAGFAADQGYLPLDFSANISPLGVPQGVQRALREAAAQADRYPDPLCRALRRAISERESVPAAHILCGNGAADLIFRAVLALRPKRALVTAPAFAEYAAALERAGCAVTHHPLRAEDGFHLREDFLEAVTPETDLVFLCEPNNPTGVTTDRPLLLRILERCRETGARVVVDECFNDFLDDPAAHTLKGVLDCFPGMLLLKAFTKLYGMAGVRLGYALCADTAFLEQMRLAGQTWEVSSLAQAAGLAALEETEYVRTVRALIAEERPWFAEQLGKLGLRVIPGEANYLLFQSETPLCEPLRQRGILLRSCGNYVGLDDTWYRTAVRTREENQRLAAALKEVLG
ncbi:histidinol-phosphate transaminase [uncultured Dysosmobacter sp.]|uniref:pyridoxal phosphate-dependent aminotransferase n=1 Tax=uncultured Dysosmobacter sp. TaxID=2591384 RepID=UPI00343EA3D6